MALAALTPYAQLQTTLVRKQSSLLFFCPTFFCRKIRPAEKCRTEKCQIILFTDYFKMIVKRRRYFFGPTANRFCADRTYITPSDKAGVAINNSPIELVAMCAYFRPALMTRISPSSFER